MKAVVAGLVLLLAVGAVVAVNRDQRRSQREWDQLTRESQRLDEQVEAVQWKNAVRLAETRTATAKR